MLVECVILKGGRALNLAPKVPRKRRECAQPPELCGACKEKFDGGSTDWREVKYADPFKTTSGESARRGLARRPRTKVGVSITIRDRCSPNHKLC